MQAIQNAEGHASAFVLVEIALLVTLTSEHTTVYLAAQSLRYLAWLESLPGAPPALAMDGDLLSKRYLVYKQLGDPRVLIVGTQFYSMSRSVLIDHVRSGRVPEADTKIGTPAVVFVSDPRCSLGGVLLSLALLARLH